MALDFDDLGVGLVVLNGSEDYPSINSPRGIPPQERIIKVIPSNGAGQAFNHR
jgi:hypothetical protein